MGDGSEFTSGRTGSIHTVQFTGYLERYAGKPHQTIVTDDSSSKPDQKYAGRRDWQNYIRKITY